MTDEIYVLEVDAYDTGEITLYFASGSGLNGTPTDTPANVVAEPRLIIPGNFEENMFRQGTTIGSSEVGGGEIRLNNADGALDAMRDYGYGRQFRLYRGSKPSAYPAGFVRLQTGTIEQVEFSEEEIIIRQNNRQAEIYDLLVVNTVFSGDDSVITHVNGTKDDLKDKEYPWVIGNGGGENWSPPMVNAAKQTFMVSIKRMNDDWTVWMQGVALTKGTKHSSISALQSHTSVSSGHWDYYIGDDGSDPRAYFRIGGGLSGAVTMKGTAYRASGSHTAANCAGDIFTAKGLSVDAASVTALNTANSALTGIYVPMGGMRCGEALDRLLQGVGAAWFDSSDGVFKLAQLVDPEGGTSVKTFEEWQLQGDERVRRLAANDSGNGVPCSKIQYYYNYNYTAMSESDLAGIVGSDPTRVSRLKGNWKTTSTAASGGVLTKFPKAMPFKIESLLTDDTAAQTESDRQAVLRTVYHDHIEISVAISDSLADSGASLSLGDIVTLNYARYSSTGTEKYLILGRITDYQNDSIIFRLWRPRT